MISHSPLKIEIEFEPVPNIVWFIAFTFVYLNKINFPGSRNKQDVTYDYM